MNQNFQVPANGATQMPQMPQKLPQQAAPQAQQEQSMPQQGAPEGQGGPNMEVMEQINNYIMGLQPEQQDIIKKASASPEFPDAMEVLFGPDMGMYFAEVQKQVLALQNSQGNTAAAPASPENPAMAQANAGQPAKATPNFQVGM